MDKGASWKWQSSSSMESVFPLWKVEKKFTLAWVMDKPLNERNDDDDDDDDIKLIFFKALFLVSYRFRGVVRLIKDG